MDHHCRIRAGLKGMEQDRERRERILANFLAALERGGTDEAMLVLAEPFTRLEETFGEKLAELEQLF